MLDRILHKGFGFVERLVKQNIVVVVVAVVGFGLHYCLVVVLAKRTLANLVVVLV